MPCQQFSNPGCKKPTRYFSQSNSYLHDHWHKYLPISEFFQACWPRLNITWVFTDYYFLNITFSEPLCQQRMKLWIRGDKSVPPSTSNCFMWKQMILDLFWRYHSTGGRWSRSKQKMFPVIIPFTQHISFTLQVV